MGIIRVAPCSLSREPRDQCGNGCRAILTQYWGDVGPTSQKVASITPVLGRCIVLAGAKVAP